MEVQLIGAIAALWAALSAFVGAGFRWLLKDREELKATYEKRIAELEAKLAGAGHLMDKQNDALIKQISQQQALIEYLQRNHPGAPDV